MAAQIRVYLTQEEADRGTTRMVRPEGSPWVEVDIPPTRHDAVITLNSDRGELRIRVVLVPSGIAGAEVRNGRTGWHTSARIGVAVFVGMLVLITVLLVVRACAGAG